MTDPQREAARAYHDIWCGDDYCSARDDGQGYLNDDLERVTAAITAYLQASPLVSQLAEAEREIERLRRQLTRGMEELEAELTLADCEDYE